ncbi:Z1 domain-containing protein [Rothia sp. (in: high G+C Gram-positive bacteria)]|uniref:Z1 domain-containing protein n=1 Tax=Rothia sp. (in: high G+C Gram-positive bacteria) TaxID=1885016 RepID=UPI000EEB1BDE|nr:hypothetical protein [Rothia sp. (in: high G+C Gram-positive bacteria)]
MSVSPPHNLSFEQYLPVFEMLRDQCSAAANWEQAEQTALSEMECMVAGFTKEYRNYQEHQKNREFNLKKATILHDDGAFENWYTGARTRIGIWPDYKEKLNLPPEAINDIDESTFQILRRSANPRTEGEKRKGLVLGYVQSGKTANFQALIAKAVDEGYRIIIVLAGMHNNLRKQTQTRLEHDLDLTTSSEKKTAWLNLTTPDEDMPQNRGMHTQLNNFSNVAIMVVKKNNRRLQNVQEFLERIDDEVLNHRPVLIIDDESDQATPNTLKGKEAVSTINGRIRDIWGAVKRGTYVAYTATPFANILIDPTDEEDLYPEDFVITLPKPEGYLGADKFFNTSPYYDSEESENEEPIQALSCPVPVEESTVLVPQGRDLSRYSPEITPTLEEAIYWFVLATAIREIRTGQRKHSSMLVHTSHRTEAHTLLKDVVDGFIQSLSLDFPAHEEKLQKVFNAHIGRAEALRQQEIIPSWKRLLPQVKKVIEKITVKVDNGYSDDRLIYPEDDPQTVIAIGGGTLSRGLTLEGLVVSFFLRSSNTYDTLLQMGRWFGFRTHYADLVRVWVGPGLLNDYRHLAIVERQIREEISSMNKEGKRPRELALKILTHPGRLDITNPSKMTEAQVVKAGLGGTRKQTVYLNRAAHAIEQSHRTVQSFISEALAEAETVHTDNQGNHLIQSIGNSLIVEFFRDFWVADRWMKAETLESWLKEHGSDAHWDVLLVSGKESSPGTFSYTDNLNVRTVSRTPLKSQSWDHSSVSFEVPDDAELINIRALMSAEDTTLDAKILHEQGLLDEEETQRFAALTRDDVEDVKFFRKGFAPRTGLVILYVIDKNSIPRKNSSSREPMNSSDHLIGVGLVFPQAENEDPHDYVAVKNTFQPTYKETSEDDETDLLLRDESDEEQE